MFSKRRPDRMTPMHAAAWPSATSLDNLCADVAYAVAGPLAGRDRRVGVALEPHLGLPDLLDDSACQCSTERYVRHLLHAGTDYTILALVWRPRQMSPVHAHQTWCALGVHRGWMVESFFSPGTQRVVPRGCVQRQEGDISHAPADSNAVHRLANLGTETAISIHVYGAPYDRLGEQVNQVWAE
jgi:3-mercaptopropionate dioxygenase